MVKYFVRDNVFVLYDTAVEAGREHGLSVDRVVEQMEDVGYSLREVAHEDYLK
jgi:hypothetical protein